MKYHRAPTWFRSHFENESVLRTNRLHRCRTVHQNRSMPQVSPASLPAAACRSSGTAARYALQKSVQTMARSR